MTSHWTRKLSSACNSPQVVEQQTENCPESRTERSSDKTTKADVSVQIANLVGTMEVVYVCVCQRVSNHEAMLFSRRHVSPSPSSFSNNTNNKYSNKSTGSPDTFTAYTDTRKNISKGEDKAVGSLRFYYYGLLVSVRTEPLRQHSGLFWQWVQLWNWSRITFMNSPESLLPWSLWFMFI